MEVVGQPFQPGRLALVQGVVALRIVAHEHFAKRRIDRLDVAGEVLSVLENELLFPAFFNGAGDRVTVLGTIPQDGGAELFVHEDGGVLLWHRIFDRGQEGVVDHLLGGGDLRCLPVLKVPYQPNIFVWRDSRWSKGMR